jgi:hypothetical protein
MTGKSRMTQKQATTEEARIQRDQINVKEELKLWK